MDWRIWVTAMLLQPLAMLMLAFFVLAPVRYAVVHWMPECRLKRIFLFSYTERCWYRRERNGSANERVINHV